jgi:hypothetical protein
MPGISGRQNTTAERPSLRAADRRGLLENLPVSAFYVVVGGGFCDGAQKAPENAAVRVGRDPQMNLVEIDDRTRARGERLLLRRPEGPEPAEDHDSQAQRTSSRKWPVGSRSARDTTIGEAVAYASAAARSLTDAARFYGASPSSTSAARSFFSEVPIWARFGPEHGRNPSAGYDRAGMNATPSAAPISAPATASR